MSTVSTQESQKVSGQLFEVEPADVFPRGTDSLSKALFKISKPGSDSGKRATRTEGGILPQPLDFCAAVDMKTYSPHLASCLRARINATIGQGMKSEALETKLDALCEPFFLSVLERVGEDLEDCGTGHLEVVREGNAPDGKVVELHWVTATEIEAHMEDSDIGDWHWVRHPGYPESMETGPNSDAIYYARFGDLEGARAREDNQDKVFDTELITFTLPTNQWSIYGAPSYLSAVPYIELLRLAIQQRSDFFHNRGLADMLIVFQGYSGVSPSMWDNIRKCLSPDQTEKGAGRSAVLEFQGAGKDSKTEVFKLGAEGSATIEGFGELHDTAALATCSSLSVPPFLAGVTIPGKLGAANEITQALILFQNLVVNALQRIYSKTLSNTLGKEAQFSGEKFEFKKLTEEVDVLAMNTTGRAREEMANQPGRNPSDGVLKRGRN